MWRFKIFIIGILFIGQSLLAGQELVFRQQTNVYTKRNVKSDILTVYEKGDRVPVSKEDYGSWKKIIAEADGKKKVGWVNSRDLKGARIQEKNDEKLITQDGKSQKVAPIYRKKTGLGIGTHLSYYKQGSGNQDLSSSTATQMNFSGLDGTTVYLSLFGDFVLNSKWNLRAFISMRDLSRSGEATYPPGSVSRSSNLEQMSFSLGSTLKYYGSAHSNQWLGVGGEVVQVSKSDVTASSVTTSFKDDPLYFFVHGAAGYDYRLFGNLFVLPELRFGVGINGDPLILNLEILIPFSYRF